MWNKNTKTKTLEQPWNVSDVLFQFSFTCAHTIRNTHISFITAIIYSLGMRAVITGAP